MIYEKKRLMTRKIVWGAILALCILISIILWSIPLKAPNMVSSDGYINDYYEYLDETSAEIEVYFDRSVDSGYITVAFYDEHGNFLSQQEEYFYGGGNKLSGTFFIYGKVDSYEIISYDVACANTCEDIAIIFFYFAIMILPFFICEMLLSCKVYYYNKNEIIVYAGHYHHYIKVNGQKYDEHNTLISWTPIMLSCLLDDGTIINATISMSNRIALKINSRLYNDK